MKKILYLIISLYVITPAFGEIQAPRWDEFCPNQYVKATYMTKEQVKDFNQQRFKENSTKTNEKSLIYAIPVYGWGAALNDYAKGRIFESTRQESNYWADRRNKFENSLYVCNQMKDSDQKTNCYNLLRLNETTVNNQLKNEIMMNAMARRINSNYVNSYYIYNRL